MEMMSYSANFMRDITDFINAEHITKDRIVNIMQTNEGIFILNYFG